jgi:hypothetical protein
MANSFSVETRLVALWKLDNGVLTTDSKGTNTLTNSASPVTNDTTNKKEGDAAGSFAGASSQCLTIADASLDAGFPLKNGDSSKIGAIAFWFRCTSVPGSGAYSGIISKWDYAGSKISISFVITNSKLRIAWGYGTGTTFEYYDTFTVTANRWYHVGATFNGVGKTATLRMWDDTAQTNTNYSKTWTNALRVVDAPISIGSENTGNFFTGQIDEVCFFNTNLVSDGEFDRIRAGTFAPEIHVEQIIAQVALTEAPALRVEQVISQVAFQLEPMAVVSGVAVEVAYLPAPSLKVDQSLVQVEVIRATPGLYVSQSVIQLEYQIRTDITVDMDTPPVLEVAAPDMSAEMVVNLGSTPELLVEAPTLATTENEISVYTENIQIDTHTVSGEWTFELSEPPPEIVLAAHDVSIEFLYHRQFPKAPPERWVSAQTNKRKLPISR